MVLPLDSPHWKDVTACHDRERALTLLREIVETRSLGEKWADFRDEIYHQGTIYGMTSAALPHLIRLAPSLTPEEQCDLWIDIAFLLNNGAGDWDGREPVPGMQETLTQYLREAEPLALQAFIAYDGEIDPAVMGYYALACMVIAGHPLGEELEQLMHPESGYVTLECPGCETQHEVDGFGDPFRPPCAPPPVPVLEPRDSPEWTRVPVELPPGFEGFAAAARAVAEAGLPRRAPAGAVWCLVAAMVAAKGVASQDAASQDAATQDAASNGAVEWARTLLRLTGDFRCGECDSVWPITAGFGWPVDPLAPRQDPATVADSAGFKPAPGGPVMPGDFTLQAVHARHAPPASVPGGGDDGRSASLLAPAARRVPTPADLVVPSPCEVLVKLADGRGDARPPWLAEIRDGRTMLATGSPSGIVELRDPVSRKVSGELWRREGRPVTGMAFGEDLVVVYGDLNVDVWSPRAVSGTRSSMAPKPESLGAIGHSEIVAACPGTDLGYRKPMVLADRNGTVSLWETFGVRLNDPLPPDPGHRDVFAVTASDGLVVTAGRADANLRIWDPFNGMVFLVPLESAPQWITFTGPTLTAGLATGPVSFAVH